MSRYTILFALLAGCSAPTVDECHASAAGLDRWCGGEYRAAPRPEPTPKPTPPHEVCDGGARDCRDGEDPTGTIDDPTGYL